MMLLSLDLGPHASFIVLAYAFAALAVAALIIWIVTDHRRQQITMRALEQDGITRRSAKRANAP